jgi:D-alanyl-D-alanine carboxypeptidase/D-alanyl-D-alanine-endopeptidase (penicillin-binding protein 4)
VDLTAAPRHTGCVRRALASLLLAVLICLPAGSAVAGSAWRARINRIVGEKPFGVAVRVDGRTLYEHGARQRRIPASNQKLLLSMALLTRFDPEMRFTTTAAATSRRGSIVTGNLWLLGTGDPTVTGGGPFARSLPIAPTRLGTLARRMAASGITRVNGRVFGSTGYFSHDWFAPGWKSYFPVSEIPLPTALTFNGNHANGRFVSDPELRAARSLTRKLEDLGIRVRGRPGANVPSGGLTPVAVVRSQPLHVLMKFMNVNSSNFFAEVFGKRLGAERYGKPGTIDKAARAVRAWARRRNARISSNDASGLSYLNRVSPHGIVRLLAWVEGKPWKRALRSTLAAGGQGTLEERLKDVLIRAKTGTLDHISTLSGWVWLERVDTWAAFSIMSRGLTKDKAAAIEDRIVRVLEARAR